MSAKASKPNAVPPRTIPYIVMRGGTSKALFFMKDDLPADPPALEALLLTILG
jgi:2-methylaconitate cis-trans-isomerase PrpF